MGVIAKYKFNNTLEANLLPEFNSEFTSDLYTVTDEVNGDITTRTIESDSLPTRMRFGAAESSVATERSKSLLEIISLDISNCKNLYHNFRYCINLTTVNGLNIHSGITGLDNTFGICSSLEFVDTSNWDTSNVANMSSMFNGCSKLTSLDVSGWDTSSVTTTHLMFNDCFKLTSLDVSGWDTSLVTSMYGMFRNGYELTSLDVSGWDTGNVTDMGCMFYGCSNLTSLDVSNWDTSSVTAMYVMFQECTNLTTLDVSNWDTSKVNDMGTMFCGCQSLTSLDVSNWDTREVIYMDSMFQECTNLTSLDVSNWDTGNVTNMSVMFYGCTNLTSLDVSSFNTSKVNDMGTMFCGCQSLTSLDVSNWDTREVIYMDSMFEYCNNLTTLDLSSFDTSKVTDMTDMFTNTNNLKYLKCNNITTLNTINTLLPTKSSTSQGTIICKSDITNLDTTTLQSKNWNILDEPTLIAKYVFDKSIYNNCIPEFNTELNIEFEGYFIEDEVEEENNEVTRTIESCGMLPIRIQFGNSDGQKDFNRRMSLLKMLNICEELIYCSDMFAQCENLLSVCNIDTSNVITMYCMFYNCKSLTTLDVSNWNTSNVTDMMHLFNNCNKLTTLDVSNFNTSKVTTMHGMFSNCINLTSLDVSNFDTSNVTDMGRMFNSCTKLTSLDVSNFDTSKVNGTNNMFYNTLLLTDISVLYMDKSSLQKLVDVMPTDSNKTLWYKDVNIDGITHSDNITLKKYMEGNIEIVLNSPLLEGDTIEVKDGKLCHYHKMGMVVLDGSEDEGWELSNTFYVTINIKNMKKSNIQDMILCNTLQPTYNITVNTPEKIGIYVVGNLAQIRIRIDSINSNPIQWLQQNPTTVIYELATPYYEDITNLQSAPTLKTYLECSMEIDTDLPIDTNVTYRTNLSSVYVMERELDELDNGIDLGDILEGEVNE